MKYILFLLTFCCLSVNAQQDIIDAKKQDVPYLADLVASSFDDKLTEKLPLFSQEVSMRPAEERNYVSEASYYRIDHSTTTAILEKRFSTLELDIFVEGKPTSLQLVKKAFFSEDLVARTDRGNSIAVKGVFYRGIIKGKEGSRAGLSVFEDHIVLIIADEKGNYEINKYSNNIYAGYRTDDILADREFECEQRVLPGEQEVQGGKGSQSRQTGDCVEIYVEADYQAYQENGSDSIAAVNYVLALFNEVSIFYDNENIPIVLSEIKIWTQTDPYATTSGTGNVLDAFADNIQNNYNGRLAHLLSGRNLGGGIAWLNVLCANYSAATSSGPYGLSANLSPNVVPYPTYSWNINVITHELGHNFGSSHTHACVWNGNGTQIDDCGAQAGYPEGNCYDAGNPIIPSTGGTVMSYCHLVGGVGMNFNEGFGPQPGTRIFNNYNNAFCATGTVCAGVPPVNDICEDAIILSPNVICIAETYDNYEATTSGVAAMSCGTFGQGNDVWFAVEVPANESLTIETKDVGGLSDMVMEVYTGACGSLVSIACDDNSGDNNHAKVQLSNLTAGETLYVRVIENGSDQEGTFGICCYDSSLPCDPIVNVLLELYSSTNGPNWNNNAGWVDGVAGNSCDYCDWYGITCNQNDEITQLILSYNNLSGNIPQNLSLLTNLERLDFFVNNLSGSIPNIFGQMTALTYLDLAANNYSGDFPDLSACTSLTTVWLENNNISDELPPYMGNFQNLGVFFMLNNDMQGCFPASYTNKCGLQYFNFAGNLDLPNDGDVAELCANGLGVDMDNDGFCTGNGAISDCNDMNNAVYPNNTEVCDFLDNNCNGLVNEGIPVDTTNFVGYTNDWWNANNWTNGVPEGCEAAIIGPNTNGQTTCLVDFDWNYAGSVIIEFGYKLEVGSPGVGLDGEGILRLISGGGLVNYGELEVHDSLFIDIANDNILEGIVNNGTLTINADGYVEIRNAQINMVANLMNSQFINHGQLVLKDVKGVNTRLVDNMGAIDNFGTITLEVDAAGEAMIMGTGSFVNKSGGTLTIMD